MVLIRSLFPKPEVVTGGADLLGTTTKRLFAFVEKLKSGGDASIEGFFKTNKKEKKATANGENAATGKPGEGERPNTVLVFSLPDPAASIR